MLVAGEPIWHVLFADITTVIVSLFARLEFVYVVEFVPTSVPFNFHWYAGVVPPFVGVAVKVTLVPAQIVLALAAILTVGVTFGVTVIVTSFPFAVAEVWHVLFAVITTVTTSVFTNPVFV